MSDYVVVMNQGYIQQAGSPEQIYNEPENAFVADFIGDSNIVPGIMLEDRLVQIFGANFPCIDEALAETNLSMWLSDRRTWKFWKTEMIVQFLKGQ